MSDYQNQKANKPAIEQLVAKLPDTDMKTALFQLLEYTNSIKMKPQWYSAYSFNFNFKNKRVFRLRIVDHELWKENGITHRIGLFLYLPDWIFK